MVPSTEDYIVQHPRPYSPSTRHLQPRVLRQQSILTSHSPAIVGDPYETRGPSPLGPHPHRHDPRQDQTRLGDSLMEDLRRYVGIGSTDTIGGETRRQVRCKV